MIFRLMLLGLVTMTVVDYAAWPPTTHAVARLPCRLRTFL